jgi:hypothetical protein
LTYVTLDAIIFSVHCCCLCHALFPPSLMHLLLKCSPTIYVTSKIFSFGFRWFFIASRLSVSRTFTDWLDLSIKVLTFWCMVGRLRRQVYSIWSVIYISNSLISIEYCTYIRYRTWIHFLVTQNVLQTVFTFQIHNQSCHNY